MIRPAALSLPGIASTFIARLGMAKLSTSGWVENNNERALPIGL